MVSLNLSDESYDEILKNPIFESKSAMFYLCDGDSQGKELFKYFSVKFGDYLDNKVRVLRRLQHFNEAIHIEEITMPKRIVYYQDRFKGYTMPYYEGSITLGNLLKDENAPIDKKIHYLKEVGRILNEMKRYRKENGNASFFLNDLHEENFIIDNSGVLRVIDIDSCVIGRSIPFPAKYLSKQSQLGYFMNKYQWYYGFVWGDYVPDENTDLYSYIIMIINMLLGIENADKIKIGHYLKYMNFLQEHGVPEGLIVAFKRIYTSENNINPYKLLDGLKEYMMDTTSQKRFTLKH